MMIAPVFRSMMIAPVFRPGEQKKNKNGFSHMSILDKIIQYKRSEVEKRKSEVSISELEKGFYFDRKTLSLKESLEKGNRTGIIAEFKRRSPSKGIINDAVNVIDVTTAYYENGASARSEFPITRGSVARRCGLAGGPGRTQRCDALMDSTRLVSAPPARPQSTAAWPPAAR